MIVLAELSPLDTVAGSRKLLRASSANDPTVTGLDNQTWRPAISDEAEIGIRLFKGDFDGEASPTSGSLSIQIDQWLTIEPGVRRFVWQGAPIRLYAGVSGQAWPWATVFEGTVDQFSAEANTVKLTAKVNTEPFDADVLTVKYAGTGGAEGDANLKDKVKPFLLGRCFNVEPILINAVDNVLQFSGYGAIQSVAVLYERGSEFGPSLGNYANYAALVGAIIPPGQWATCLSQGMIRLGAPPFGVITGDVDGDNVGGTWWRKTGEIIQRIASNSGVSGSLIESASFTALDTALSGLTNQGRIGVFIDSQATVLETASRLAAPCNAQVGVSLLGKMFVGRIAIGSPTMTLDAQQRQLPRVVSSVETSVSPPFSYIEMGYARSWRVHTEDEIAGNLNLPSFNSPNPPPGASGGMGHIYSNADGHAFRYDNELVTSDEGNISSDEGLITSSGYENIQDLGIDVAQATADAAQATADEAVAALAALDDDGIITIDEKIRVLIPRGAMLEGSYQALSPLAIARAISTSTVTTKRAAWLALLAAISPDWNDTNAPSTVVRNSMDTALREYSEELELLNKSISEFTTRNVDRGAWSSASVSYVIGDEVQNQSSTWGALTNHTSTGGNGPPTLPTTSNSTWRLRAKAGDDGTAGLSNAQVTIYKRSATTPSVPSTTSTYTFATAVLTGHNNGWTQAIPASDGNPLYATTAAASSSGATDTIATGDWSAPIIVQQEAGATPKVTLSGNDSIPSSGSTETTIATDSLTIMAGGKFRVSGTIYNTLPGTDVSEFTLRLKVAGTTIFSGLCKISNTGVLTLNQTFGWPGQLPSNPAGAGSQTITVTRQRGGTVGSGLAEYDFNFLLEQVS